MSKITRYDGHPPLHLVRCVADHDQGHELSLIRQATEEHVREVLGYWIRDMTHRVVGYVLITGIVGAVVGVLVGVGLAVSMWGRP